MSKIAECQGCGKLYEIGYFEEEWLNEKFCPDCVDTDGQTRTGLEVKINGEIQERRVMSGSLKKNPALAFFFGILLPGLGHVYNGTLGRAICIFFGVAILIILFLDHWWFIGTLCWIFSAYCAYEDAKLINSGKLVPY